MFEVDLKTGLQEPIARIDEAGCCFLPQILNCHQPECGPSVGEALMVSWDQTVTGNWNKWSDQSKLKECSGESNATCDQYCCQWATTSFP